MADEEQVALLKRGIEAWNHWMQGHSGPRPDLREADLREADLREANLIRANLNGADLSTANLVDADLSRASLNGAILNGADLSRANLSKADLFRADLSRANLSRANLSRADLSRAHLGGANLDRTDLKEANLYGATVGLTTFGALDLSDVKGLCSLEHLGPSTVGIDTIYLSKGRIPETFLRGAGVPDSFITDLASLAGQPIQFYSCFISYSHANRTFARRLYDALQDRGIRCWLDEHQLRPGQDIDEEADRGIQPWDKILLCASRLSLQSWWVDKEIGTVLDKEQRLWTERGEQVLALIPLSLDGYMFSGEWQSDKAAELKTRLAADFTGWEHDDARFEREFERVMEALQTDGEREPRLNQSSQLLG